MIPSFIGKEVCAPIGHVQQPGFSYRYFSFSGELDLEEGKPQVLAAGFAVELCLLTDGGRAPAPPALALVLFACRMIKKP